MQNGKGGGIVRVSMLGMAQPWWNTNTKRLTPNGGGGLRAQTECVCG